MTIPGPARTGLVLRDPFPWPQFREIVETAEDTGYESLFVPEISGREAFATLAAAAAITSRIRLGTGVITMWSRRPSVAAMGAATLQEVSGGRAILGIGAGTPPAGTATTGAHDRLASYLGVVRQAWSGSPVEDD